MERMLDVYGPRVHEYLRGLTQDEHTAEDLTQEVFLRVHQALPGYDPSRDPRPWIFTIAKNKLRDHWRLGPRLPRVEVHEDQVARDSWPDPRPSAPEAIAYGNELSGLVRAAIEALPATTRATVRLRVYDGLPFDEIARIVNREEGAVRKRYSRALATLRCALEACWKAHVREAS